MIPKSWHRAPEIVFGYTKTLFCYAELAGIKAGFLLASNRTCATCHADMGTSQPRRLSDETPPCERQGGMLDLTDSTVDQRI
jgi:hypothetical protein